MIDGFLATIPATAWRLIVAIATLLTIATLIGQLLHWWLAARQAQPTIDNLNRSIQAWWLIALSIGIAFLAGDRGVCVFFAWVSLLALREFVPAESSQSDALRRKVLLATLVAIAYWLLWQTKHPLLGVALPLVLFLAQALARHGKFDGLPATLADRRLPSGLLIAVIGVAHAPAILFLPLAGDPQAGAYALLFLLLVVQLGDVLQYLGGKLAGQRAIAPRISPNKTVEGTVGGIVSASALGGVLATLTPFDTMIAIFVALLLSLLGFAGGLILSAEKRRRGIKDWGQLLAGHGGLLDRLDSLFLSAPVFYYLLSGYSRLVT